MTSYDEIFSVFVVEIKSLDVFQGMSEETLSGIFKTYLNSSLASYMPKRLDLSDRSDDGFNSTLSLEEIKILVNYMIVEWIQAEFIVTPELMRVRLNARDWQTFSNANHLKEIVNFQQKLKKNTDILSSYYSFDFKTYAARYKDKRKKR